MDGYGQYSSCLTSALFEKGVSAKIVTSVSEKKARLAFLPDPLKLKRVHLFALLYTCRILYRVKDVKTVDRIHTLVEAYAFIGYLLSKLLRKKHIITVHGTFSVNFFTYPIFGIFQKIAYRNADRIVCVSSYTERRLLEEYPLLKNTVVIPNGYGGPVSNGPRKRKGKRILTVGAIKVRKGQELVVEAVKGLVKEMPDIEYHIFGSPYDVSHVQYLRKKVQSLGLETHVFFNTNISKDELREQYRSADLFVMPSISERFNFEGFGLVYLEANAHGIPVIGAADSGAEQAIKDGYNGFLVPQKSVIDIQKRIEQLFNDPKLYTQMSACGLTWAKEHSWSNIAENYMTTYRSL